MPSKELHDAKLVSSSVELTGEPCGTESSSMDGCFVLSSILLSALINLDVPWPEFFTAGIELSPLIVAIDTVRSERHSATLATGSWFVTGISTGCDELLICVKSALSPAPRRGIEDLLRTTLEPLGPGRWGAIFKLGDLGDFCKSPSMEAFILSMLVV